ncbi:MAG: TatD family hydrolase, partial [Tepidiforma sp.]
MTATLFDTHAHLTDPKLAPEADAVIARAAAAGVREMLTLGYDLPSSEAAAELARRFPGSVYAAVGLHPHEADTDWEALL